MERVIKLLKKLNIPFSKECMFGTTYIKTENIYIKIQKNEMIIYENKNVYALYINDNSLKYLERLLSYEG